ncbi:MAG: beta-ketoacyl-ACP synthase II [Phycisphaeraceae bacterium]|nr:beta-ketoacyl-ACP synthase II [Phycisphaerales bacterium]MCB9842360.1 beta-ketoacyl-ACP synthase II [Phycisphaeraceae bacterium]
MVNSSPSKRRVVITGMGAVTNLGHDAPSTWDAMVAGRSGISRVVDEPPFNRWGHDHWSVHIAGAIRGWDEATRLEKRETKRLDRFAILGISAAIEAVEDSKIDFSKYDPTRSGAVIGSGVGGIQTIEMGLETLLEKGPDRLSPFTVPRLMANAVAGDVSIRFGLQGPSSSHTTACASSGHSMGDAFRLIRSNRADVMLAGGSEGAVSPLCLGAFMTMRALSTRNDDPTRASRPFDRYRDGFVLSEGAAVFMLEELEQAKARNATIYAEVVGYAASSDASHITAPDPNGSGAARSMRWALEDAGLAPDQIDYVNAHGTSTPLGDKAEVAAVTSVFGDHARKSASGKLLMSSTKSMTGHCLGASGAVETIACIGAIRHSVVPPTINCEAPDDGFDIDFVSQNARDARVRYAMNNTFGFGGHNVTIIFGAYQA